MNLTWPLCPSWWSGGLLAHLSTLFFRSKVWGGRSEILHCHPPHILYCHQGSTQGLISLGHPAMEPLVTVLKGRKHFHPSCANKQTNKQKRAQEFLSHAIPPRPVPSHPHTLIPTYLHLPSTLSQMCETAISWTTLSIILPKSYDSHVLLKIFYMSYDFFFSVIFTQVSSRMGYIGADNWRDLSKR